MEESFKDIHERLRRKLKFFICLLYFNALMLGVCMIGVFYDPLYFIGIIGHTYCILKGYELVKEYKKTMEVVEELRVFDEAPK